MLISSKNPHGGDIYTRKIDYDFSANTSPLGTPQKVKDAVIAAAECLTPYPDPYCKELRLKLSEYTGAKDDNIICGNGAAEVIFAYTSALKPKRALIVSPTFCEYEESLALVGCEINYYKLKEEDNFELSLDILEHIKGVDLVVICNPNNPTGRLYSSELMLNIAKKCSEVGVNIFVDECFFDLTNAEKSSSLVNYIDSHSNIFVLKAFTKSYGMAGVRLGYGICSNKALMESMSKRTQVWNVSTIAQMAGIAAIDCKEHLESNIRIINDQRPRIKKALIDSGFKVFSSDVNFILFKADSNLGERMLELGVQLRSCANFNGLDNTFYRCAVKSEAENNALISALERIGLENKDK